MENSGYVVEEDQRTGDGYKLDSYSVVQTGRWREFRRTVLIAVGLAVLQYPLRQVATGHWSSAYADVPAEVPGRLSLMLDAGFVFSYLLVAYRAFGLVRASRTKDWAVLAVRIGLVLVIAGAVLDLFEDLRLWILLGGVTTGRDGVLTLTFEEALGAGPTGLTFTWVMRALVLLGYVALVAGLLGCFGARARHGKPPMADVGVVPTGGDVICCSGGGIRSASFSLGGLQALQEKGLYARARAVVGVSGGGYTGAAYHVVRWNPGGKPPTSGADDDAEEREWPHDTDGDPAFSPASPETGWLRRHTRYVLGSVRVALQAVLSLGFGIAVNLLLLTTLIGGTAWLLAWLMLASGRLHPWDDQHSISGSFTGPNWSFLGWVWVVPALGLALFIVLKGIDRFVTLRRKDTTLASSLGSNLLLLGGAATVLLIGVPWLLQTLGDFAAHSSSALAGLLHQLGIIPTEECNQILPDASACGVKASSAANAASIGAVKVPGISIATVVGSILAVLASAKSAGSAGQASGSGVGDFLRKLWAKVKDPVVPWLAVVVVAAVLLVVLLRWVAVLVADPGHLQRWGLAYAFGAALVAAKVLTDANRTSMHHFFRERISYAFLVRRTTKGVKPVPYRRPLRFSEASPRDHGPQLVSCAVANVTDEEIVPSRRGCVPFVFDHQQIGLTDALLPDGAARRASATYEFAADPYYRDATVPAAVAMSAAAFSPLAGRENVRVGPYRAVLALGNARLGVWLPNPLWADEVGLLKRQWRLGRWDAAAAIAFELPRNDAGRPADSRLEDKYWQRLEPFFEVDAKRKAVEEASADLEAALVASGLPPEEQAGVVDEKSEALRSANDELDSAEQVLETAKGGFSTTWVWLFHVGQYVRSIFKKPGFTRLLKEGVGKASVYDRFLYVTDGGHYDNLGLIEALRRRPDRIYVLDASNDAEDTFRALGRAIATARMDLNCEVRMDPRGMRRLAETRSGAAWCIGEYEYATGEHRSGKIFLAKAIMLEGLSWDIETYQHDNVAFPRTSTNNQLYSEFDFEAYRALGQVAVEKLLASPEYAAANPTA